MFPEFETHEIKITEEMQEYSYILYQSLLKMTELYKKETLKTFSPEENTLICTNAIMKLASHLGTTTESFMNSEIASNFIKASVLLQINYDEAQKENFGRTKYQH
jgi:hypothetical protein